MNITTYCPDKLSTRQIDQIAELAGIGFGQGNTASMRQDTRRHIIASDYIQTAHDGEQMVAFAMVRRCLWQ